MCNVFVSNKRFKSQFSCYFILFLFPALIPVLVSWKPNSAHNSLVSTALVLDIRPLSLVNRLLFVDGNSCNPEAPLDGCLRWNEELFG